MLVAGCVPLTPPPHWHYYFSPPPPLPLALILSRALIWTSCCLFPPLALSLRTQTYLSLFLSPPPHQNLNFPCTCVRKGASASYAPGASTRSSSSYTTSSRAWGATSDARTPSGSDLRRTPTRRRRPRRSPPLEEEGRSRRRRLLARKVVMVV